TYPFKELSGCGIGFKLVQAYCQAHCIPFTEIAEYLDLVAVSIASDIVAVEGENRILAHFGLERINSRPSKGIRALLNLEKPKSQYTLTDLVFGIGPRINAAGRINHARDAVRLLISECDESALLNS